MADLKNPVKAIRAYCIGCMGGQVSEVEKCWAEHCELFPFRMGKNPYRAERVYTPEQRAAMAQRLADSRKKSQESQAGGDADAE